MALLILLSIPLTWLLVALLIRRLTHSIINSVGGGFLLTVLLWTGILWLQYEPKATRESQATRESIHKERIKPQEARKVERHIYYEGEPIDIVRRSPCKNGGTIDKCLEKKIAAPAVTDLGWSMSDTEDGFIVEKEIQIQGLRSSTIYRWHVSRLGNVSPINGHAIGLSNQ